MNKSKIELVKVTKGVIHTYRNHVKGNKKDGVKLIRKKLTRNILCGKLIEERKNQLVYGYGCLNIVLDKKSNTVVYISNYCSPTSINKELKEKLDIELSIVKVDFMDKIKRLFKAG